jgi:hypothetical protein
MSSKVKKRIHDEFYVKHILLPSMDTCVDNGHSLNTDFILFAPLTFNVHIFFVGKILQLL